MSYFLLHQNVQGKHECSRFPVRGDRIATILRELENENRIFDQTFIEGLNGVLKTRDIIIMLIQKSILDAMSSAFLRIAGVFSKLELQTNRARMKSRMENAEARGKMIGWWATIKEDYLPHF